MTPDIPKHNLVKKVGRQGINGAQQVHSTIAAVFPMCCEGVWVRRPKLRRVCARGASDIPPSPDRMTYL